MQIRVAGENDAAVLVEIYSYYVEKTAVTFEYKTPCRGGICRKDP